MAAFHRVAQGGVIGDDHHAGRDSRGRCHLGGQAEIQPVASVVLDHQHGAARPRRGVYRRQHRIDAGRGEHVARHGSREHALPDIAGMGRLVPAAATGDDGDGTLRRRRDGQPDHHILAIQQGQCGVQLDQALEHLANDGTRVVDELLHGRPPVRCVMASVRPMKADSALEGSPRMASSGPSSPAQSRGGRITGGASTTRYRRAGRARRR